MNDIPGEQMTVFKADESPQNGINDNFQALSKGGVEHYLVRINNINNRDEQH